MAVARSIALAPTETIAEGEALGAEHPMLALRADSRGMLYRGRSADAAEGIAAFLEKRPA